MTDFLPETMTCIEIPEPGDCDALKPGTRPVPEASKNEVLIKVAAAGVNRPDIVQRLGIRGVPTVILFKGGEEMARSVGFEPEKVRDMVEQAMGTVSSSE